MEHTNDVREALARLEEIRRDLADMLANMMLTAKRLRSSGGPVLLRYEDGEEVTAASWLAGCLESAVREEGLEFVNALECTLEGPERGVADLAEQEELPFLGELPGGGASAAGDGTEVANG